MQASEQDEFAVVFCVFKDISLGQWFMVYTQQTTSAKNPVIQRSEHKIDDKIALYTGGHAADCKPVI